MKKFSTKFCFLLIFSSFLFASFEKPSEAGLRERQFFSSKIEKKFWIRGRCWMSNGKGDDVIDYTTQAAESVSAISGESENPKVVVFSEILGTAGQAIQNLKTIVPKDGHAKCIVKKRKRQKGIIRVSRNVTVNMRTFGYAGTQGDQIGVTVASRSKTCGGKNRCTVIMKPEGDTVPVGMVTCIEAKGKSRVVLVGLVPDELEEKMSSGGQFRSQTCSERDDWQVVR